MSNKTQTPAGLELTRTGILQYPKDLCKYDPVNGWILNENEPLPGQKMWQWSHTRTMSKKSVGIVISSTWVSWNNGGGCWVTKMTNLEGKTKEVYENMIITEDQYQEVKNLT